MTILYNIDDLDLSTIIRYQRTYLTDRFSLFVVIVRRTVGNYCYNESLNIILDRDDSCKLMIRLQIIKDFQKIIQEIPNNIKYFKTKEK